MIYIKVICSFILILFLASFTIVGQENAKEIFDRATQQMLTENFEMGMDIKTTDKKGRVKEKTIRVLMAKIGKNDKTKVIWLKPERAKGTTVIITDSQTEKGIIEVYTPSNGKTRKMKASSSNMKMIGSEFSMTAFASHNSGDLSYKLVKMDEIEGQSCYLIEVKSETAKAESRGELWIEEDSYKLVQIKVFDEAGKNTRFVKLANFQKVSETVNKIQAMYILNTDYENNKTAEMHITVINRRKDLTADDFVLPIKDKE